MYLARDSRTAPPEQVVFGFLDRFIDVMETRGGLSEPLRYGHTFTRVHDPDIWRGAATFCSLKQVSKSSFTRWSPKRS